MDQDGKTAVAAVNLHSCDGIALRAHRTGGEGAELEGAKWDCSRVHSTIVV
jgi:hypothetical protein